MKTLNNIARLNVTVDEIQRDRLKDLRQGETLVIVRSDQAIGDTQFSMNVQDSIRYPNNERKLAIHIH